MSDIEKILYPSLPSQYRPKDLDFATARARTVLANLQQSLIYMAVYGRGAENLDHLLSQFQQVREAIDGLIHFLTPDNSGQGNLFDKGLTND